MMTRAQANDLAEILALQKAAYRSEAELLNDFTIAPLRQTLADLENNFNKGIILKAVRNGRIIGSVRAYVDGNTLHIGKLIVDPGWQNQGVGTQLLSAMEKHFPAMRYELFTSTQSIRNLSLYSKNGYREFRRETVSEKLTLIFLEKM